jgi:hypothetical protein
MGVLSVGRRCPYSGDVFPSSPVLPSACTLTAPLFALVLQGVRCLAPSLLDDPEMHYKVCALGWCVPPRTCLRHPGVTLRARWVMLRARWVTRRARWVTLRARWVMLRARWVTLRASGRRYEFMGDVALLGGSKSSLTAFPGFCLFGKPPSEAPRKQTQGVSKIGS